MRNGCARQGRAERERSRARARGLVALALALPAAALLAACAKGAAERGAVQPKPDAPRSQREPPSVSPGSAPGDPPARPSPEANLGVRDLGIFSDLDARVQLALPAGLRAERVVASVDRGRGLLVLYDSGHPLKVYPLGGPSRLRVGVVELALRPGDRAELEPLLRPGGLAELAPHAEPPGGDRDGDGIPDALDLLIGAHKTALNAAHYDCRYVPIAYPAGDVPRGIGVCSDVVVRALRNAGLDLQRELQKDRARTPRAYPQIRAPNPSIDHRRVRNLLPLFLRRFERHGTALSAAADPLRPGDVLFLDTFPERAGAEHIGIVSERLGPSGTPLIINNWTEGTVTKPMELLTFVPISHRFRVASGAPAGSARRSRASGPIAAHRSQLVTVVSSAWSDVRAELRRWVRAPGQAWRAAGPAVPVVLGHAGYGWGDGLHGQGAPSGRARSDAPDKREGDGRSPAGAFELGPAYGYGGTGGSALAYTRADESLRCVDDPSSAHYNRVLSEHDVKVDWRSAERMLREDDLYELAIVIGHNRAPVTAGHGSCIFLHVWASPDTPVTGCTALDPRALSSLARWLEPSAVLVALPRQEYAALAPAWGLPTL